MATQARLRECVLPPTPSLRDEWILDHVRCFHEHAIMVHTLIECVCNDKSCPVMRAGHYRYLWIEEHNGGEGTTMSAPEYCRNVFKALENTLDDSLFPPFVDFSSSFLPTMRTALKRIFRVFCHVYHHHWDHIERVRAAAHVHTVLKHLALFACEHDLLPAKEMVPVDEVVSLLFADTEQETVPLGSCWPMDDDADSDGPLELRRPRSSGKLGPIEDEFELRSRSRVAKSLNRSRRTSNASETSRGSTPTWSSTDEEAAIAASREWAWQVEKEELQRRNHQLEAALVRERNMQEASPVGASLAAKKSANEARRGSDGIRRDAPVLMRERSILVDEPRPLAVSRQAAQVSFRLLMRIHRRELSAWYGDSGSALLWRWRARTCESYRFK